MLITLLTDFGTQDWFVGTMKGVILRMAPRATIVDITHEIAPGDIRSAAFALAASCPFVPKGTIHVAVIDPGVGSSRKAIVVQTTDSYFVGPDNGLLSLALKSKKIKSIHALQNSRYFLPTISQTFHGRDIFAPVAAHLCLGLPPGKLGPALEEVVRLDWPEPRNRGNRIEGQVVYVDRFGNAITNISCEQTLNFSDGYCQIAIKPPNRCPLRKFYQSVPVQSLVAVPGSSGFLEIAVNGASAKERFGVKLGTPVSLCCP